MKIQVTKSSVPPFEEYCKEIKPLWESRWLTNYGSLHKRLEKSIKEELGVRFVSLFVNGHSALQAAIASFGFPAGSEIITTPFTFVSTVNAIVANNLVPVFCDIDRNDLTIDDSKIEDLITNKTVAILGVHVYGNICHVENIERIAKKHKLKIIYDAAHAFYETYKGIEIGCYGDITMFSFHATKVFNTIEGGCLTYHNKSLVDFFNSYSNFVLINGGEDCLYFGGNIKMNEFQAAMGICNLRHITEYIANRKRVVDLYHKRLKEVNGITCCMVQDAVGSNYAYFPVIFDGYKYSRDEMKDKLENKGIVARKYFYPPINDFDCYKSFKHGDTPIARYVSERILCLPLYPELTNDEANLICDIILDEHK